MTHLKALLLLLSSATTTSVVSAATIPKTIIQTSKSSAIDRSDWLEYQNSLRTINPDFDLMHYSDEEAASFITEHYGDTLLEHAYQVSTPIMRADLFRLAAIYKLGGFYMDMDMLAKSSLTPIVEDMARDEYAAVFPKEWWMSGLFYRNIFPGKELQDAEDHWQMGQYAFAAVPEHPFLRDVLEEATIRSIDLMSRKGSDPTTIRDTDILAATGPYLFTELYHAGRKAGKYADVRHLAGDSDAPVLLKRHGGHDWHKFGGYAEHMLSHTWVRPERRGLETYSEYGAEYGIDELYGIAEPQTNDEVQPEPQTNDEVPADDITAKDSGAYYGGSTCFTLLAGISGFIALFYA